MVSKKIFLWRLKWCKYDVTYYDSQPHAVWIAAGQATQNQPQQLFWMKYFHMVSFQDHKEKIKDQKSTSSKKKIVFTHEIWKMSGESGQEVFHSNVLQTCCH